MMPPASRRGCDLVSFRVAGEPKPQPRPRAYNRGKHASVYNPDSADAWKAAVAAEALRCRPPEVLDGPLWVCLAFWLPRPKRLIGKPAEWHTGRPDVDNLAKAVLDAIADTGWWRDDGQVAELSVRKFWARHEPDGTYWTGCSVIIEACAERFDAGP
jgi:Holliday junction resolvase RusA-like endonuclease